MSRKRPGKIERLQAKRNALVQANLSSTKLEPNDLAAKLTKALGPKSDRGGSSRERLKAGSYGAGFQGPRGFNSPKDHVTKREQAPGRLAPRDANAPTFGANGSKRHAGDISWAVETLGYDYSVDKPDDTIMVKRPRAKGKPGRWRKT